jgi:Fur family zinc uptake transcriptional regulator
VAVAPPRRIPYIGDMPNLSPHHHHHEGTPLPDLARQTLEHANEQWTPMRASVFAVINGFDRPVSAYDIADGVSAREGRRIAPNSIYRILDLFVANNVVRRIESANAYVANSHPGCVHDCIFMVCDTCGKAIHIDDDDLSQRLRSAAGAAGFSSVRPVIEVKGKCADCA